MTPEFVEQVIRREKPDGIVISMGGQTALNCAVQLFEAGILEKYNVKVTGSNRVPRRAYTLALKRYIALVAGVVLSFHVMISLLSYACGLSL